ncbi:carboxypeptidase-like regulatory domain-containing protein [Wenyingzhuangia sp. IMCC45533]
MTILHKQCFILLIFFSCFISEAQEIEVDGIILDEVTKTPVEFATVQIESTTNNRLLGYGFSDEKGKFTLEANTNNETNISLVVTYIGFTTYKKTLTLNNHQSVGQILLHPSTESLEEIVITATPPVLIKKDTTQFNASSFKTKEDAVAEDLLKKLPGVSIDNENGSIQVNGVDVTKILVNGEPFFTDNPKVAMKILSKDVIDKIQITDTRTDEENFTGSLNSEDAKTINITLKKKEFGNIFGNATAGYGTNNRYETNGVINRVYKKSLLTVLAFSNNVNKNNFSYDDEEGSNTLDRLKAIKTESNLGANYSDKFKNGSKINFDYLYSDIEENKGFNVNSINLQPGRNNLSQEVSQQSNEQSIHRGNVKAINSITENFRVIANARFFKKDREFNRNNNRETSDTSNNLINTNTSQLNQQQNYQALNATLSGLYNLKPLNSYINLRLFANNNTSKNQSRNRGETNFTSGKATVFRNQLTHQEGDNAQISGSIKYGQRFKENQVIEYEFIKRSENKEDNRDAVDIDDDLNTTEVNNQLSFRQKIEIDKQEHKLSYVYKKGELFFTAKFSHLTTQLSNQELDRDLSLTREFKDLLIFSKLRYKTKKGFILNGNYKTKSIIPRNNELLNITDNSNPTRITTGNENLKRELEHLLSLNLRYYGKKSKIHFFNRFSYSTVQDKIIDKSTIDDDLVITRTYINNSNNHRYIINGNVSKDYKRTPFFYNLRLKWFASIGEDAHFINNESFKSTYQRFSPSLYSEFNYNDLFEINPYYRLFSDNTQYSTNSIQDQSNIQHILGLNVTTFAPKKITLYNQLQYILNPKFDKGSGRQALVWNITANYSIIPNKAKIKLTVFNILNQYNNVTRTLTESRNSTFTYDVLQQYAMLSFKYIFKN